MPYENPDTHVVECPNVQLARDGSLEMLEYLFEEDPSGIQKRIAEVDGNGDTLVIAAAQGGSLSVLKLLATYSIKFDIDFDAKNHLGLSALDYAKMQSDEAEVMAFIESRTSGQRQAAAMPVRKGKRSEPEGKSTELERKKAKFKCTKAEQAIEKSEMTTKEINAQLKKVTWDFSVEQMKDLCLHAEKLSAVGTWRDAPASKVGKSKLSSGDERGRACQP